MHMTLNTGMPAGKNRGGEDYFRIMFRKSGNLQRSR